jgi:transketolase
MSLRYLPAAELERLRSLDAGADERIAAFADACRVNTLYMIARAGSGHIGTSFSAMDVVAWLHLEVLGEGDRYFSSKGHDAPGLYALLIGLGRIDFELLHRLRRLDGLPGHPDVLATPEVVTNTGSLGMGVSKAKGFVYANRAAGHEGQVFVLTGDGELQEGQFWESLGSAANRRLGEIVAIVDHNKIQSDTWVSEVSDLGDLEAKGRAFGWAAARCDGHSPAALREALAGLDRDAPELPKLIVADTLKGAGVSFMEPHELPKAADSLYGFHSGAPSEDEYERGLAEMVERLDARLEALGERPVELAEAEEPRGAASRDEKAASREPQRLVAAYGEALASEGEREPRLVALDADLVLDTGLIPFRDRFPDRFVECGIAEQDMVSQAGAMALSGLLPAVHSFACFLAPRANEQIYNNATEGTKVIYAGSLVGLVPGGPGHSHQSVRDVSALGAMPGMDLVEPFCESEVAAAVRWAVRDAPGSVYIRLVSVPWELPFDPPEVERLERGRGTVLREGGDGVFVATGPVMVAQAWGAAEILAERGFTLGVVALPWLRSVDGEWLAEIAAGGSVVCLDNHYVSGGQGDAVLAALSELGDGAPRTIRLGVESVPACGTNDEVLHAHRLDAASVAERVAAALPARA